MENNVIDIFTPLLNPVQKKIIEHNFFFWKGRTELKRNRIWAAMVPAWWVACRR
uniref:Uncharacterized protein n=1 Tax=Oryza brachyantha TaxID=4533 RepID=J3N202_ORYBR